MLRRRRVSSVRLSSPRITSPAIVSSCSTSGRTPFDFMELQDVQELTNFFERRVSAYQLGVTGAVAVGKGF